MLRFSALLLALGAMSTVCYGQSQRQQPSTFSVSQYVPEYAPDMRQQDIALKVQKGDFIAVPIPISNPTVGTGLVAMAAYYYGQTKLEESVQPPAVTQVVAMYTDNQSYGVGLMHQDYWRDDRWRFTGIAGYMDLQLDLLDTEISGQDFAITWQVTGSLLKTQLLRSFAEDWYLGGQLKIVDNKQTFGANFSRSDYAFSASGRANGFGVLLQYDSRDNLTNAYNGQRFEVDAMFNDEAIGSSSTYQSYQVRYRYYQQLMQPLVLALEARGCAKYGETPLWDYCTVGLRGFSATTYLNKASASGQAELRWKAWHDLGLVAFAGLGYDADKVYNLGDSDRIDSVGVGVRYMVLDSQRINLRIDYAHSGNEDAVYLSVTEAF
ncbi:BamA/TamA family outer membrane protein [Motilimonas pumila]|uniref:BamA/TamA family outer membrane protein n=1 Tax=Motilimonas pumila TaxID=2303987 RepID=UPI0013143668|nr:BamA/TamA family outer membrane protein [Motilimonas pumila]